MEVDNICFSQPQTGTMTILFDHEYLLVTRNRRCLSVIVNVHYVSAIFKLYLSDVVQLFMLLS